MSLPFLHFAHANGFPAGAYNQLLRPLAAHFRMITKDRFGHDPAYPVDHNWQSLVDELLDNISQQAKGEPVIGLGHSLGGVLTYMAALKKPQMFQRILLMDPPLMLGRDALGLKLGKRLGFIDRITPAGITRGRRSHWPDRATAETYFNSKKLFRRFHPDALADYLDQGTEPDARGGLKLRFHPDVEIAIFRNLPDNLSGQHRKLQVRVDLLRGKDSELLTPQRYQQIQRLNFHCHELPGGHMFPLEYPEETCRCLLQLLS